MTPTRLLPSMVVICFQFWVSLTSLSLIVILSAREVQLWFAFNFGYLWHRYHSNSREQAMLACCDLLSILGIFDIAITRQVIPAGQHLGCDLLSILGIFDIAITTVFLFTAKALLWFAFNFGYLWHRYHSVAVQNRLGLCCDLLSILGIFDIAITEPSSICPFSLVVICFQFWVSLTSLSLSIIWINSNTWLWFAFNFGYLWHRYHSVRAVM